MSVMATVEFPLQPGKGTNSSACCAKRSRIRGLTTEMNPSKRWSSMAAPAYC